MVRVRPYKPWTLRRAARVGWLAGRGATAAEIFADPVAAPTTMGAAYLAVRRFGVPLGRNRKGARVLTALSPAETTAFAAAAAKRGKTIEQVVEDVLSAVAGDGLIDSVLDDGH